MTAAALALAPRIDLSPADPAPPPLVVVALPSIERDRATTLLLRGAHRLDQLAREGALADPWPSGDGAGIRARYVANCLRELDTFLKGLLDHAAPSPFDGARRHNAANRVHAVARQSDHAATTTIVPADVARLRALGRSRACLWHCHGLVRRADQKSGAWMTAGWHAPASSELRRYALGERLAPVGRDLVGVAHFYRQLAYKVAPA